MTVAPVQQEDIERFLDKISPEPNSGCWLWAGTIRGHGYGAFWMGGTYWPAHRIAYELWQAEIPNGLEIDHLCRVKSCVNPAHLEPVTHRENILRAAALGIVGKANTEKTHCKRGHPFDAENTYIFQGRYRACRICRRSARRRRYYNEHGRQLPDHFHGDCL